MKTSTTTTRRGLALGGAAVLAAVVIACIALRLWLEPSRAVALVELVSFCR
ncbi:hypothetical protein [Variovorax sp. dw_954]|uniref:hypothetical protein n=1 Tax=Variovorax sp. dw_954 TaxID=2720078 RepID=UPI001BD433BC|nr:hypothetical protein [Variovorax sp. dw_954]